LQGSRSKEDKNLKESTSLEDTINTSDI